jgi:hypothetical protein
MSKPKLRAKTPDSTDVNSLIDEHEALIADPRQRLFAIVEFDVTDVNYPVAGDTTASLRLAHIETVHGADEDEVVGILDRVFKKRTGANARPGPESEDTPLDLSGIIPMTIV